jgi:hypothetical protein
MCKASKGRYREWAGMGREWGATREWKMVSYLCTMQGVHEMVKGAGEQMALGAGEQVEGSCCCCETPALLTAAAARARVSALLAALCASGFAARPELTPPLYGSVNFTRACLRLRMPIRCVAGGSGCVSLLARARFFFPLVALMRFAVSAYMELR